MFGFSYGEILLLLGATAAVIGPKELPIVARTAGRLVGRAVGYSRLARSQFDAIMQNSEVNKVQKELKDTQAQVQVILHELRRSTHFNSALVSPRLVDNLDNTLGTNANGVPGNLDAQNIPKPSFSKVSVEQTNAESMPMTSISKGAGLTAMDSATILSQASAYARLAESSALKDSGKPNDDLGLLNVLPVSAECAEMLPNRRGNVKGSDIVLEAVLEAEVAHYAKDFGSQPEYQIKTNP